MFITALPANLNVEDWDWELIAVDGEGRRLWQRWDIPFRSPASLQEMTRHPVGLMVWYDHPRYSRDAEPRTVDNCALIAEICLNMPVFVALDDAWASSQAL
ncbi:hypothetical protein [Streptomyces sp. NPDC057302]|uniref:hypothetical protein n=1 Tax=Streptomyces sp. NPDC057302 TaxID=3346094 RepID=UPI00363445B0